MKNLVVRVFFSFLTFKGHLSQEYEVGNMKTKQISSEDIDTFEMEVGNYNEDMKVFTNRIKVRFLSSLIIIYKYGTNCTKKS